jgi:MFS family permease
VQGMAAAVFALPFVLFSGTAGDLSERFSKRNIVVLMKVFEIGVMLLGVIAFMSLNWIFLLIVLFFMGTHSAFFGPSKYGVIPEIVSPNNLLRANGIISMTTFAAILLGQALAGPLLDGFGDRLYLPALTCVLCAVIGTVIASYMSPTTPQNPSQIITLSPFGHIFSTIKRLQEHKGLMRFVLLYSLFWFNGSVIQQAVVGLGDASYLNIGIGEKRLLSYVLVSLSVSIIIGSLLTPTITKRISIGRTVVLGTVLMVLGQLSLLCIGSIVNRPQGGLYLCHLLVIIVGMGGAMFVVPIQTILQHAPEKGHKGQTVGVNNFMNFLFMFLGGLYYLVARLPSVDLGPTITQAVSGVAVLVAVILNHKCIDNMKIGESS